MRHKWHVQEVPVHCRKQHMLAECWSYISRMQIYLRRNWNS